LLKSFELENDHLLNVLRGAHVSDRLVRCGPDCLTSGVTHGDKFHLGAEEAIAGIALQYGGAQGLVSIVDLIDALLYFSNREFSNGWSYPSQPNQTKEILHTKKQLIIIDPYPKFITALVMKTTTS
jgi:hypothetical protein